MPSTHPPAAPTLTPTPDQLLDAYGTHRLTEAGHAPATIARERRTIIHYWRDERLGPADATPATLHAFCHRPPQPVLGRGNAHDLTALAPSTSAAYRRRIRTFYAWWAGPDCPHELRAAVDPLVKARGQAPPVGPPRHFTPTQVARLLDAARAHGDDRDVAVVVGLYCCALRNAELASLDAAEVDLDEGEPDPILRVRGKGVGGGKVREIPLLPDVADAWRRLLIDPVTGRRRTSGPVIGNYRRRGAGVSTQTIWRICKRVGELAGVPHANPHRYRHSAATHLLDGGAELREVQELLGHTRSDTVAIYTGGAKSRLRSAMRRSLPVICAAASGGHRVAQRPTPPPPTVPPPRREPGVRCRGKTSRRRR